jgi:hypothetical protein
MGRVLVGRDVRATSQATTQKIRAATITPCANLRGPTRRTGRWNLHIYRLRGISIRRRRRNRGGEVGSNREARLKGGLP